MSQIYKSLISGPVPPSVPTSFQTQNGTAVPIANVLIVHGTASSANNNNGIIAQGGVIGTGTANEVDITITNRATGQVTTTDATLTTIISFPLGGANTVYSATGTVTAISTATGDGASYDFSTAVKTNGVTATEIGSEYPTEFSDASIITSDIFVNVSGNNMLLQVQGVVATTIHWDAYFTFRQVS